MQILLLTAVMLATTLSIQAQVVFDNLRDVGPPPSALGIYNMITVVDNTNADGSLATSVPLPNGGMITLDNTTVRDDAPLTVVSPGTFFPWGNGYSGKAYGNLAGQRTRLFLSPGIKAFYLYAKPLFIRADITVTAYSRSAINGNVNSPQGVSFTRTISYTEAQFFGFHVTNPDDEIVYIVIQSTSPNPYVGEFGFAYECTDSAPYLTSTNNVLTCANPSSTLTAPAGGSSYTFTGPNSFSQSGTSNRVTVTAPGTYSLLATLAGGCTARGTVTLTEDKAVPSAIFRNDGPLTCSKTSVTLTAFNQNLTNATYVFSGPNGFSQAGGSSTASVSAPGTYSLIIRGSNGCLSTERTTDVTSNTNVATTATQPLFDLYNATGGANWTRKDNWLTGCTPCNWYGVSCDGNGRVTGLNLANNHLSGTIPTSLSALSALQSLNLSANQLGGSIPAGLSALRALQRINLIGNQLTGSIPVSLSALTNLQSLELGANALTGGIPTGIGNLTALQTLNLSRTQLGGTIPASLGQLTQLQNLLLNESALTGSLPASLGTLAQLQNLQLYTNQLSGCFPGNYTTLCGKSVSFASNPGLPGGGDFAAFCRDGSGSELVVSQYPQSGSACVGSAFSFSVVARGAGSYQWYKFGPGEGQFQRLAETGPVLSFSSVSASDAGTYQVYINYGCGNGAVQSDMFTLTVPPVGVANLVSSGLLSCTTTSVTLTASNPATDPGQTYHFSSGATQVGTGNTATVSNAGVYSVTVVGSSGCSSVGSTTVTGDQSVPTLSISPPSGTLTCGNPLVTLQASSSGGSLLWSTGATTPSISVSIAGTYSVTITSPNGCSASASAVISGDQNVPVASINPSSATLTCASPTVSLTAVGGGNVLWSTGSTERVITVNTAGTYSVTIMNGNGCSASASVIVSGDQSAPTVSITGSLTVVPGGTTTLTASGGESYRWSTGQTTPGISATAGTYSVTATTVNGCFATASATVTTGTPANTAPTVANPVSPQSATVGVGYTLSVASTFTDAQTPNSLSLMVAGLPANLSLSGTTISGTPSTTVGSPYSVTLIATDPGGLSGSTVFSLSVSPVVSMTTVPTAPFAITGVTTIDCTPVANRVNLSFNPRYAGLNGTPVSFSVANELAPTTDGGPYTLSLYADNPVITLRAVQAGVTSSFTYNWLTACRSLSTTPGGNTPPTVANAIPPQSATVGQGFSYVIPASTFTDAQTPGALALSVAGLPAGLVFTAPATISGSASGSGVSSVTVTATDPGNLSVSTSFTITVSPASMTTTPTGGFALTGVTTVSCTPVANRINLAFAPQYAGLTGSPVSFQVLNELAPTTDPGPYSLSLYADNPVITLRAVQSGVTSSFSYNWLTACRSLSMTPGGNTPPTVANAIPPQSATVDQGSSYVIPASTFTDAQTPNSLVLSVAGLPAGLNLVGTTISGVPSMSGVSMVTVTASDPGNLSVSTIFTITVSPASVTGTPTGSFAITGVTGVSCQTLSAGLRRLTFSPAYSGLNGQAVSFEVLNELGTTAAAGPYSLNLYTDNPVITLKATQAGSAGASSFAYSWLSSCPAFVASGRLGSAEESGSTLRVTVLGNPVTGESIELEIRGAAGQAVTLRLVDLQGKLQHQQQIQATNSLERVSLPVSSRGGVFLLHVQTAQAQQQLKVIIR